jgi:hypothetical protein
MGTLRFDPQALYDAVDAQRRERGMTWRALSEELGIATSSIKGMTQRRFGIELDGVIGMARWLGRTVESFAGGAGGAAPAAGSNAGKSRFPRFRTAALYTALNAERERRGLTWDQCAAEIWPSGPWGTDQLRNLAKGGRADVYSAVAICEWLGSTIQSFQQEPVV